MPAVLFITTSFADYKLVNRLLFHLRDWEYGCDPTWDNFHLVTTDTLPRNESVSGTKPPISENDLSNNMWVNKSISDIESFIIKERKKVDNKETELNLSTFTILDGQGVKDGTIIVLDSPYNADEEKIEDKFNKVRVPWEMTYIIWCNLDIANMNFEDFVEDKDGNEVEFWKYAPMDPDEETARKIRGEREKAIVDLEEKGMA